MPVLEIQNVQELGSENIVKDKVFVNTDNSNEFGDNVDSTMNPKDPVDVNDSIRQLCGQVGRLTIVVDNMQSAIVSLQGAQVQQQQWVLPSGAHPLSLPPPLPTSMSAKEAAFNLSGPAPAVVQQHVPVLASMPTSVAPQIPPVTTSEPAVVASAPAAVTLQTPTMAVSALQPTIGLPPVVPTAPMQPNATATVGGNTFNNTPPYATLAPGVAGLPTAIPFQTMPRHLGPASINQPMTPSIGTPIVNLAPTPEIFKADIIIADCIVAKEVANKAVNAQYVNLSLLLVKDDYEEEDHLSINKGSLKVSKRRGKPIDTYDRWIEAMLNYEQILTTFSTDSQLNGKLAAYRRYIHGLQVKFIWPKVSEYDQKFRTELARCRSFEFNAEHIMNFTQVFDAMSLKVQNRENNRDTAALGTSVRRCHRCNSTNHFVKKCPFQAQAASAAQVMPTGQEVCYNYNDGHCSYRLCKRRHACIICGGQHPKQWCQGPQVTTNQHTPMAGNYTGWANTATPPLPFHQPYRQPTPHSNQPAWGDRPTK